MNRMALHSAWVRPLGTLGFMMVLATVFSPRDRAGAIIFWKSSNISNVLSQAADTGILAMGMTLVIISGGIDLSVGALLALSCTIFAYAFVQLDGAAAPYLAVFLALSATTAFGLANGLLITRLRMQPFIVTLAAMIGSRGLARWLVGNSTIAVGYDERTRPLIELVRSKTFSIGTFIAVTLLCLVLLNLSRFGRHLLAIGGSESAARLSGIGVASTKIRVYLLSGLFAGIAGILFCAETHQGDPKAGMAYELDAIAAAVIGGTSLMGGKGGIIGTLVGVLALGILSNLLGLRNVDENVQWMLKAGIILAAVWLQSAGMRRGA